MKKYWHKTSEEVPENGEQVFSNGELLSWNEFYQCWDDEEGDDFKYAKDDVKVWCRIPDYDLEDIE